MKLKVYRIMLLSCLFATFVVSTVFFVLAIINLTVSTKETIMDGIMYVVCLLLNMTFIGLEVFNTFYSVKKGSQFAKNLSFNDDGSLNKKLLTIFAICDIFVLFGIVYIGIVYKGGLELPLSSMNIFVKRITIAFFLTLFTNITFTLLFPLLGKEDKSFQLNNKKSF